MMKNDSKVTATDTTITIDTAKLAAVSGGAKPGPNGEGCTGPFPFPRPRPQPFPMPGGPIVDPVPDLLRGGRVGR